MFRMQCSVWNEDCFACFARGALLAINDHYAGDANQNMYLVKHEYKLLHLMFLTLLVNKTILFRAVDHSAHGSMKSAASCVT